MSTNTELAKIFGEMAAILELIGADRFRVNAHQRVARVMKDLVEDAGQLAAEPKKLEALDGVGKASVKKIVEYVETGRVAEHQELLSQIPTGLLDVLEIQGLGPKTVKMLWEQAEVTDLTSLRKAIDTGCLADLPRMGAKTIQNIRESLEFAQKSAKRTRLGTALTQAERIIEQLHETEGVIRMEYAGSLRRGRETIGDIDILASTTEPKTLAEAFTGMDEVEKVLAAGATKCSVRLKKGVQVDLRLVEDDAFGAALAYFTGSKQHNVRLRERAIGQGYRLNEYGLFKDDGEEEAPQTRGVKPVAAKTEADIYKKLGLEVVPPELREDRGELTQDLPALIDCADIRADLHIHTTESDGKMAIEEIIEQAKARGYHTVAITDHSKSSAQANGLSEDRLRAQIEMVREVDAKTKGLKILAGSEVDILADGALDYDDDLLAELDLVIASPHVALKQKPEKATARLLAAIRHPLVHIIGHPTGRIINRREGLSPDLGKLIEAAVECGTALEINANYFRLDLRDVHVKAAVEAGCLISINTDSHTTDNFDQIRYGVLTARRGWLTADLCVNAWTARKLSNWLKRKR